MGSLFLVIDLLFALQWQFSVSFCKFSFYNKCKMEKIPGGSFLNILMDIFDEAGELKSLSAAGSNDDVDDEV